MHGLVPESFETYQIAEPGDIILRTTDLQNDHTSLRVGRVRQRGIITSAYLNLRVQPGMCAEYGYQFLNVWDLTKNIYAFGSGLRQNLDFSHFKRMPIVIPPPDEQETIVRFLDYHDRLIRKYIRAKQKLIALLTEQKQAIIQHAVTRGLSPDVKLKPSGVDWLEVLDAMGMSKSELAQRMGRLFHELGHLLLHGVDRVILEDSRHTPEEREADAFARDTLAPPADWEPFVASRRWDAPSIVDFSRRQNLHPGIVVGRLQHEKRISPAAANHLRTRYTFA